ncbi:HNH endonuclease signature motif containing protein [Oricola nitratireducens]|uniref:HNH endonuclease signature motif containing protein n=1 Tax=Oricola nitratireducens TaxID=2775868 RepID=UPI001869118F|nr:HNH endonuclease signature motif containing protein [Oricola nitratireducens]
MKYEDLEPTHLALIDQFDSELEVTYREERYSVRDNGAIFRLNKYRKRARLLDKQWTFGRQTPSTGYMLLAGVPVHRIVCSAFHGAPPSDQHVVDHIDTNRANNRPENLRWVTRLENVLLNPISARRIEFVYGSIEAFFENPKGVQTYTDFPDVSWMRTVTKDEAQEAKESLLEWAQSGAVPKGGALGEWLYGKSKYTEPEPASEEYDSLTPSVVQVHWRVPSEFPACPSRVTEDALVKYASSLEFGHVFVRNDIYQGLVVQHSLSDNGLVVLSHSPSGVKDWAIAHISTKDALFYHKSEGTFFTLQGALKKFCRLAGDEFDESIDDYC